MSIKPTFVLVHGSWHTGETWHRVVESLEQRFGAGCALAPDLSHTPPAANAPAPGLHRHIDEVAGLIVRRNLTDVVLVGHSYSGLVIAGVADRMPERIAELVYLDAFIPSPSESLFDVLGDQVSSSMREGIVSAAELGIAAAGDGDGYFPVGKAASYLGEDAPAELQGWLQDRLVPCPVATFAEPVSFDDDRVAALPARLIRCAQFPFLASQEPRAQSRGMPIEVIDGPHDVMLTHPERVAEVLAGTR